MALFPQMYGTQKQHSSKSGDPIVKFWPLGTSNIAKAKREMRRGCWSRRELGKNINMEAGMETRGEERRGLNESRETFTFDD